VGQQVLGRSRVGVVPEPPTHVWLPGDAVDLLGHAGPVGEFVEPPRDGRAVDVAGFRALRGEQIAIDAGEVPASDVFAEDNSDGARPVLSLVELDIGVVTVEMELVLVQRRDFARPEAPASEGNNEHPVAAGDGGVEHRPDVLGLESDWICVRRARPREPVLRTVGGIDCRHTALNKPAVPRSDCIVDARDGRLSELSGHVGEGLPAAVDGFGLGAVAVGVDGREEIIGSVAFSVGPSVAGEPIPDGLAGAIDPVICGRLLGVEILLKGLAGLVVLDIPVVAAGFGVVPECVRPEGGKRRVVVLFQRVREPTEAVVREPLVGWPVGFGVEVVAPQRRHDHSFVGVGELWFGEQRPGHVVGGVPRLHPLNPGGGVVLSRF